LIDDRSRRDQGLAEAVAGLEHFVFARAVDVFAEEDLERGGAGVQHGGFYAYVLVPGSRM
jgi:hypothetical protein